MFQSMVLLLLCIVALSSPTQATAHGSVTPDDDLCIINIGYYRAHFKIYLPETHGHKQYCEDIPRTGDAVFVMEYEHTGLGDIPVDFRVIRNVTGKGVFTNLEDVQQIEDLDEVTLFHYPPTKQPDVFTYLHSFDSQGEYVGIVTVQQPETGELFTAVFAFEVGFAGVPIWAWFIVIAIFLQVNYLWMSGTLARWLQARRSATRHATQHG